MKQTVRILKSLYVISILASLLLVVVYESNMVLPGEYAGNGVLEYYWTVALELTTIVALPLALRLFKFASVSKLLKEHGEQRLTVLASSRLALIVVPMFANTLLYYMFMSTTFGYMAIICLICMVLIYPSESRCLSEISVDE